MQEPASEWLAAGIHHKSPKLRRKRKLHDAAGRCLQCRDHQSTFLRSFILLETEISFGNQMSGGGWGITALHALNPPITGGFDSRNEGNALS